MRKTRRANYILNQEETDLSRVYKIALWFALKDSLSGESAPCDNVECDARRKGQGCGDCFCIEECLFHYFQEAADFLYGEIKPEELRGADRLPDREALVKENNRLYLENERLKGEVVKERLRTRDEVLKEADRRIKMILENNDEVERIAKVLQGLNYEALPMKKREEGKRGVYSGVGYRKEYRASGKYKRPFSVWASMLERCYNKGCMAFQIYGGRGVRVEERWKCFDDFYDDIASLPGWDEEAFYKGGLELDKDGVGNGLLYSRETCQWVARQENMSYIKKPSRCRANPNRDKGLSALRGRNGEIKEYIVRININRKNIYCGASKDKDIALAIRDAALEKHGVDYDEYFAGNGKRAKYLQKEGLR